MITFEKVRKVFRTAVGPKVIVDGWSGVLDPTGGLALFGRPGSGKSTLLKLAAGVELPDQGRIRRTRRVSFPLGYGGLFHPSMSGRENVTFVARIYGADVAATIRFVREFAEIGDYFEVPMDAYSSVMRAKVAFGVCLAIPFDVYLIDELMAVGNAAFRPRCQALLAERRRHAEVVMISQNLASVREHCRRAALLDRGRIHLFDNIDEAVVRYEAMMKVEHA